jgi:predicted metal-binding membrane protein
MDWGMRHMDVGMDMWIMPQMVNLDVTDLSLVLLMWTVMMAAMMLPSVLPVIVVLVRIGGSAHAAGFIAGYLMAWGGFSVGATLLHWALLKAALVSPMMESVSVPLSAAVLAAAGLFPIHAIEARLSHPLQFAMGCGAQSVERYNRDA